MFIVWREKEKEKKKEGDASLHWVCLHRDANETGMKLEERRVSVMWTRARRMRADQRVWVLSVHRTQRSGVLDDNKYGHHRGRGGEGLTD